MRGRGQPSGYHFVWMMYYYIILLLFSPEEAFCPLNYSNKRCSSLVYASAITNDEVVNDDANNSSNIGSTIDGNNDTEKEEIEEEENCDYLYHSCNDDSSDKSSYPVIEYKVRKNTTEKPKFIYGDPINDVEVSSTYRVVEFYAPWCLHCQRYKVKYIRFANDLTYLVDQINAHNKNTTSQESKLQVNPVKLSDYKVQIYAMSCTRHKNICVDQEIRAYPFIKIYKAGSNNGTLLTTNDASPAKILKEFNIHKHNAEKQQEEVNFNNNKPSIKDMYNDALVSLDYEMRKSIKYSKETIKDGNETTGSIMMMKNSGVLRDWFEILSVTLPPMWLQAHSYIGAIKDNFEIIKTNKTFLRNEIIASYSPTQSKIPKWSKYCTKDKPGMGYTCGLWELFHIMSLGVVEWNAIGVTEVSRMLTINNVGTTLRNYIESFHICDACRKKFTSDYDNCSYLDRCNRMTSDEDSIHDKVKNKTLLMQFPIWLWEFHNAFNVRLHIEKMQRDLEEQGEDGKSSNNTKFDTDSVQNLLWPSKRDCPHCWYDITDDNDNKTKISSSLSTTFNLDMVYKYLRVTYWPDDELNDQYNTELSGRKNAAIAIATATRTRTNDDIDQNQQKQQELLLSSTSQTITKSLILSTISTIILCFMYYSSILKVSSFRASARKQRGRRVKLSCDNNENTSDNGVNGKNCCRCFIMDGKTCKSH